MVYVFLAEGFEEVEALTAVDVLRRAGAEVQSVLVPICGESASCGGTGADERGGFGNAADGSAEGDCAAKAVCGAHGICVNADIMFDEADFDTCEMIVLPGGMPGTLNLAKHKGLAEQVISENLGQMVVTPKDIDSIVEDMSGIIATGINMALFGKSFEDVRMLIA